MRGLPDIGSVVGVDVGYSPTRRSSAICRLWWNIDIVDWKVDRFRYEAADRARAFQTVVGDEPILVAALDGPLRRGLDQIGRYRLAEKTLTSREIRSRIGKPGQSSSRNGRDLNQAANLCAQSLLDLCRLGHATHREAIHDLGIVEAFPTSFLGLLLDAPEGIAVRPPARSDAYYSHLAEIGGLDRLLSYLLPGRALSRSWNEVIDHDERAAIACALTALCVAADDYLAVGDEDGWIILPPESLIGQWAKSHLPRRHETALD